MKKLLLILILFASSAQAQIFWPRWSEFRLAGPLPDTNGVWVYPADGKLYFMDWTGANRKRLRIGDLDFHISYADSLMKTPYLQVGTGLPGVASFPYGIFTNVDAMFYTNNIYVRDSLSINSYNGNGSRLRFIHGVGTQILNNKGIAFQITQNADASALMVDSAYLWVSRLVKQGASDTLATMAYARSVGVSGGGGLVAADSVSIRNYSNSLYLKNADSTTLKNSLLKNADSTSLRNYSNSLYLKNADSTTLKNSLLKNADSTSIRNYSNSLYLKNADSTSQRNYSTSLYMAKATARTYFSAGLIDSVKTSDTVFVGWVYPGITVDTLIYSGARSQSLTARLELVDSLYQTAAGTLVDTTTCTLQKTRRAAAVSGGTFTLTAAKILRMVFPAVGTMPKQFNVTVVGH